jgi:hypothetical protein
MTHTRACPTGGPVHTYTGSMGTGIRRHPGNRPGSPARPDRSGLHRIRSGGRKAKVIAVECTIAGAFVLLAAAGVAGSAWLLVLAYTGHGLKDFWQERRHYVAGTRWWPPFCAADSSQAVLLGHGGGLSRCTLGCSPRAILTTTPTGTNDRLRTAPVVRRRQVHGPAGRLPQGCRGQVKTGSGTVLVRLVGEQDAAAEQAGAGASVHLAFEHLDAVDVSFHAAGAPPQGGPGWPGRRGRDRLAGS